VLCPGDAYDRSPCGTGTSAKLACLAADGKLAPGARWRQESIIGSVFEGSYALDANDESQGESGSREALGSIVPTITGRAHIMADGKLCFEDDDPFAAGIALTRGV